MPIFSPEAFQGSLTRKNYFEGWYCKQVSADRSAVFSFIPGISLSAQDSHAFIQVINGITAETHYCTFPVESFSASSERFDVTIGKNRFSRDGISIDIDQDGIAISGELTYKNHVLFPQSLFAPGIMGPFSYIPRMECNHGMVSANHAVMGTLSVAGSKVNFSGGDGYIEKDWGRSFPQSWIWVQCNSFETPDSSFMLSVAKIPSMGTWFTGFVGFFYCEGVFHTFATWNGSKIISVDRTGSFLTIVIKKGLLRCTVTAEHKFSGMLRAPSLGGMNRHIKESVDSSISVKLENQTGTITEIHGTHAGLEIIEAIFSVLKDSGIPCSA